MRNIFIFLTLMLSVNAVAQSGKISGLNSREFNKYWKIESESPLYKVTFKGDTADIISPKGLTLWRKEKLRSDIIIEYDACVAIESEGDRLSDLNCFWMASDPKSPESIWKREKWRGGIFERCYSLQLYYLGYGGNNNTTTRFRRYQGNEEGVKDPKCRPSIIMEYKDDSHLLKPNHWYHIKIMNRNNRVSFFIDGKCIVDYNDAKPLKEGWFGFRTTLSHTKITNFRYSIEQKGKLNIPLNWIGNSPKKDKPVSFGVPFDKGELSTNENLSLISSDSKNIPVDMWPLAYWPDGSVKWCGIAAVIPKGTSSISLAKSEKKRLSKKQNAGKKLQINETPASIKISNGEVIAYISKSGKFFIDSLFYKGVKVGEKARVICGTQSEPVSENSGNVIYDNYESQIKKITIERAGDIRALVKFDGILKNQKGREWLPFTIRAYFYGGSGEIKIVHSLVFDGDQNKDFIRSLGIRFDVPMREALYNRHVAFSCSDGGVWSEPVQPLIGRRILTLDGYGPLQKMQMSGERIPDYEKFDAKNRSLLDNWASWDSYRLSQLNADAFTIRKRTNGNNPWIGTFSGTRSNGYAFVGDVTGGLSVGYKDFWQSYPSSIEITNTNSDKASLTAWLWSPEAEPMDLRHYDNVAHDLNASYEDVQEGLSTPYGVGRTSTITIMPQCGYKGKEDFAQQAEEYSETSVLMPTAEYLHDKQAFGIWSLPDRKTSFREKIEDRLDFFIEYYKKAIEENKWYGFWNYGDVMHTYDPVRHTWLYDVGGYAWDNTELATNMWIWYSFLRTGRADIWKMAEAMSRHTCEVDVYHLGPNAGLGSRHNVSHWGCGAKEARISQAAWNRFYYYLTTDERSGDLMSEVKDADQKLYTLDPMRLAQPRSQYPCTAPARLRIGPDWLAYAGNWMTEWERTRDNSYRDKILAGMKSIVALPSKIFTGPLALGYDPKTGIITSECDTKLQSTNHLMTIMGGFEIMNEMIRMVDYPEWNSAWLEFTANYKDKAFKINRNRFRISRLLGYAAYHNSDTQMAHEAWSEMMPEKDGKPLRIYSSKKILPPEVPSPIDECIGISTNDVATWGLDAIYLQEVVPMDDWK